MHDNTENKKITNFVTDELYPELFHRVREAFPEMDFQPYKRGWASPYKLSGDRSHDGRRDKSVITPNRPNRILEQGGDSIDLISFYMKRNKLSEPIDAIKALASICRLQLPEMEDNESYRLWREKQERLERAASKMEAALYSDEGTATLNYLRERGYSDEFIKWGGFGFIAPSLLQELRSLFTYTNNNGQEVSLPCGVGQLYTLAIPYRTGNQINGFVFRSILPDEERTGQPKYKDAFISAAATKRYNLFGLMGFKLTGNGERDRDITIVEGEIDALRASFCGVPNVVAASGGNVSREALKEAKRRGVKRVTLLFDTEATERGQEATDKKAEKAIASITEEGLTPFVCSLPSDDGKEDADSYLQNHSGEQLSQIIEAALPASLWLFRRIQKREFVLDDGYPEPTDKELDEFKRQTIALCNSPITSPTDRDIILREFSQTTGGYITKEALQEEADALKLAEDKNRQKQEAVALTAEALKLANNGSVEAALSLLRAKLPDLSQMSREAEFSSLLLTPTAEGIRSSFKEKPTGVKTNFAFTTSYGEQERLILPVGLTYICAPTSHGKSRFLENLAIQLATDREAGDVLYFSFEEDITAVELQLLNIYANITLSRNNLRSLHSYYTTGGTDYFGREADVASFKRKEAAFLSLLSSGKLRVYYKDYDSTELIEAIRYIAKQRKVKAAFIDYIQLLHTRGTRLQRREELGEMCKNLWRLAEETCLPIVLAAQLNRETYSPLDMTSQNIAEAADIERSANTIILLWNSSFSPTPQKSSYYKSSKGEQTFSDEAQKLEGRGFQIGTGGKIYAKISKNRGAAPNIDAILDFNGNTGKIAENYTEPQPSQGDIFPDRESSNYSPF